MARSADVMARCPALAAVALVVVLLSASCSEAGTPATSASTLSTAVPAASASATAPPLSIPGLAEVPLEARAGDGRASPRPAAYWELWNSCAPENRAAEAAANGGRAKGFILVDDLLASPGIEPGEHRLTTCEEALAILRAGDTAGSASIEGLAADLLVAELNLMVGSESCPAVEEATVGSQIVLTEAGYAGPDAPVPVPVGETGEALPSFVALLEAYIAGDLCY